MLYCCCTTRTRIPPSIVTPPTAELGRVLGCPVHDPQSFQSPPVELPTHLAEKGGDGGGGDGGGEGGGGEGGGAGGGEGGG